MIAVLAICLLLPVLDAGGQLAQAAPAQSALAPWQLTGALTTARGGHSATLLPDGRVLVVAAGGNATADPAEGSIERYDPGTGTWEALTSMRPPRRGHSATLLPDGRVLIAGGDGGPGQPFPQAAVLFDPATSALVATGDMQVPRAFHSATLLRDGRVMVLGGGNPGFLDTIEVYDPVANTWAAIGTLDTAREYHTATLLPDGSVLVAGGAGAGGRLTSIEQVDASGGATEVAQLITPRGFHTANLLPDGDVLLVGGDGGGGLDFPPKAERYHPQTHGVVETAPMAEPRRHHSSTLLPDGRLLVVGGDTNSPRADTEVYDPQSDSWAAGPTLNEARRLHSTTLLYDGSLLAAGGYGSGGWLSSAERMAAPCDERVDIPVSQAQPDATFAALLAQAGITPGKRKGLGDPATDRVVAHSFTGLQRPGMRIAEASLTIVAEPGGWDANNDAFHILVARMGWASSPRVGWFFESGSGLPGKNHAWGAGDSGQTIVTDLHIDGKAVLAAMNDEGRLDVFVQDDTIVRRMFLRLRYVCCDDWVTQLAPRAGNGSELDSWLSAIGFPPASRKGFGDTSIDKAVGHSFVGLGRPGASITAAELTVMAQPGSTGANNDAIHALVASGLPGTPPVQRWFFDAGQASPNLGANWSSGAAAQSFTMKLTDPALLAAMNAQGRLDTYTQDDTTLYGLRLRVFYGCCGEWTGLSRESTAQPSAELLQFLADGSFPALKDYGDGSTDRVFADSFAGLQRPGMHVSAFELVMKGTQGGSNDTISALVAGAAQGARINWWLASNWQSGQGRTTLLARDLSQSYTLFEALNQSGRLDVYVQDDGRVDALELRLRYECGPMPRYSEPGPKDPPPWTFLGQPKADLWVDDTPHTALPGSQLDEGDEPDWGMVGHPAWQSRAIWVRNEPYNLVNPAAPCANSTPETPLYGGPDWKITVCVRVVNRGDLSGAGLVRAYWAQAALGLGWDAGPGGLPGTTHGDWTELTSSESISLAPGEETVVGLEWLPPAAKVGEPLHTCLLARIEADAPDAIHGEDEDIDLNVRFNNNIAWRNLQVITIISGMQAQRHPVILRNLSDEEQSLAVRIRPAEGQGEADFFEQGRLDLDMPAALGDRWKARGGPGRGFRVAPDGSGVIVEAPGGALIEGLILAPGESFELGLRYGRDTADPLARLDGPAAAEAFDVEVVQLGRGEDGSYREQGGVAYAFREPELLPPTPTPTPIPSAKLANISTRGWVGTGDDVMIGGFIVAGGATDVIIRAIGPDLAGRGVPGVLEDPMLEIYDGAGTRIAACDDWMTCIGAGELGGLAPRDPREAALKMRFAPGGYTAIVRGKNGTTGVALVEVFHAGGRGVLSNISTRGKVLTEDRVMIGGLIVRDAPGKVIFRAIGPDLLDRGVSGVLEDPWMEIYDGAGERILVCDDWRSCPGADELGALEPNDPREPATVLRVEPGSYTAIIRGKDGGTGIALVEAFVIR